MLLVLLILLLLLLLLLLFLLLLSALTAAVRLTKSCVAALCHVGVALYNDSHSEPTAATGSADLAATATAAAAAAAAVAYCATSG
jgi:hypothetical protein